MSGLRSTSSCSTRIDLPEAVCTTNVGYNRPQFGVRSTVVKLLQQIKAGEGKVGYALLWLLGVPLPVLLIIYFLRGCD